MAPEAMAPVSVPLTVPGGAAVVLVGCPRRSMPEEQADSASGEAEADDQPVLLQSMPAGQFPHDVLPFVLSHCVHSRSPFPLSISVREHASGMPAHDRATTRRTRGSRTPWRRSTIVLAMTAMMAHTITTPVMTG